MTAIPQNAYTGIFAVVVSILAIITVYLKWAFGYWNRRNVLTPPITFPFGNASNIILQKKTFSVDTMDAYFYLKSKGAKFGGYFFFSNPSLMLLDADLIKIVLTKDFAHFTDRGGYVNEKIDPLSAHLVALRGSKWRNMRTKLTPTFTSGKMKMMFDILLNCSDDLVKVLNKMVIDKTDIDIKEAVGRFTTDVIGSCAFGIECNSLKSLNSEFMKYGKKIFELDAIGLLKNMIAVNFPGILRLFSVPVTLPSVTKFFMNTVKETVRYREENAITRKDFMHLLIQLRNNVKIKNEDNTHQLDVVDNDMIESLTIEEVAAQAFVFFAAGFETSSTSLAFCLYELVSNLDIQDKLRDEIKVIVNKHGGKITYDALIEMTYMDKCINETLRKYPPIPVLRRICTQSYKLPGSNLVLEKGAQVFVPLMALHHDSEHYPDPEKFDPERFCPENKSKRHPYSWLPFGEGPRNCIGLRFGMMQMKVALVILLKNFKFILNPKTHLPLVMDPKGFFLSAKGGIWLNAEKV